MSYVRSEDYIGPLDLTNKAQSSPQPRHSTVLVSSLSWNLFLVVVQFMSHVRSEDYIGPLDLTN